MKRLLMLMFVLMLAIFTAACGGKESGEQNHNTNDGGEAAKESGYQGKSYEWKIGFNTPEESVRGIAAKKFKEVVEEKTGGKVTVDLFAAEVLGSEQEMLEQVASGALDMQLAGGSGMQNIIPEYAVLALPFMVENYEEAYNVLDGEIGEELKEKAVAAGYKVIAHTDLGFGQITNSKQPVKTPNDLKGLKIRSPQEPTSIETFKQLGSSVTTMAFTEVYMGLQQNVIDGQFNPLDAIYENNFHEVQKYLTLTNHFYYHVNFIMNHALFESLDPELQQIVLEAGEAAQKASRQYTQEKGEEMLDVLAENLEIEKEPDLEAFRSKINYKSFSEFVGSEFLEKTRKFIEENRK
ncbi:TRAP transporter substrate-binding protein [bacterium LRH843]|nr:TRAP transporter substrate-binding protein [bacterium LRH843]